MSWPQLATLNGTSLPPQFSYKPYIPKKRNSITPTAGAVITQYANSQIVHGADSLPWTIDLAKPTEFQTLWDLYNTSTPQLYTFVGYWGETLEVYFTVFDPPSVRGRIWALSGQFQVIDVVADYEAVC